MGATILTKPGESRGYGKWIRLRKPAEAHRYIGKSRCHEDCTAFATTACGDTARCYLDVSLELKRNMDNCLRLIIYRDNAIFDNVILRSECVLKHEQVTGDQQRIDISAQDEDTSDKHAMSATRLCTRGLVSYLVSAYIATLSNSYVYRNSALRALFRWLRVKLHDRECVRIIFIRLRMPRRQFLDYKW